MKHIFNELHYELTRKIAEGGMGVVYEARSINLDKKVALKVLLRGEIADSVERFAQAAARAGHEVTEAAVQAGYQAAIEAGATAAIQPGGSVRDEEVIAAADEREVAMVFTGARHFRH